MEEEEEEEDHDHGNQDAITAAPEQGVDGSSGSAEAASSSAPEAVTAAEPSVSSTESAAASQSVVTAGGEGGVGSTASTEEVAGRRVARRDSVQWITAMPGAVSSLGSGNIIDRVNTGERDALLGRVCNTDVCRRS